MKTLARLGCCFSLISSSPSLSFFLNSVVFPLTFVLCLGTFPVPFINSSRFSSLAGPGLGEPLSSYLEGALYKLLYIYIHICISKYTINWSKSKLFR